MLTATAEVFLAIATLGMVAAKPVSSYRAWCCLC